MFGQVFTTSADFTDDATLGRWGSGYQVLVSCDQPVIMQFAKLSGHIAGRVVWEINDVPFPPGDYRFLDCHGIRFKTDGDTAATVYAITVFPEDPPVQGFSPSTTGGSVTIPTLAQVLAAGNDAATLKIIDLGDPTLAQDAATKAYVDAADAALTLDDILTAGNDGGAHLVRNIADPILAQDAATRAFVEALVVPQPLSVVLAAGNDGLGAQITDIADPTLAQDAATKAYVDSGDSIPLVTAFPGSPANGQRVILVDSTSAPTYAWLMQYNSTLTKWIFLGGSSLYAINSGGTITNSSYADFPNNVSVTVPNAGDYLVRFGATYYAGNSSTSAFIAIKRGAAASSDSDAITKQNLASNNVTSDGRTIKMTGLTAAEVLKTQGRAAAGSIIAQTLFIDVTPIFLT